MMEYRYPLADWRKQRRQMAWLLRMSGLKYREIGQQMGITHQGARRLFELHDRDVELAARRAERQLWHLGPRNWNAQRLGVFVASMA